jgi:hypothetical protein
MIISTEDSINKKNLKHTPQSKIHSNFKINPLILDGWSKINDVRN